ncbi:MAG: hypothetical protein ACI3ZL_01800 [Candidatus Cryptobacteroides sp.]
MENRKDILAEVKELKSMPFSVPEGYFDTFKEQAKSTRGRETGLWRKVYPVLAMAAMFLIIVTGGTFLMKTATPQEGMSMEDYLVCSGLETSLSAYSSYETQIAEAEISGDDIVQYLIYTGVEAESLGN